MRLVLTSSLIALATALAACGGPEASERSADALFDTTRSDVAPLRADDGAELGLINTTHGVVWDYARGYSRFGADNQVAWGPQATFPAAELEELLARDALRSIDGAETSEQAATRGGVGGVGGVGGGGGLGATWCKCCYWRLDGTCGCYECYSY